MPLSKGKMREYMKRKREAVIPKTEEVISKEDVIPVIPIIHKCRLSGCVICEPEVYQEEYRKAFGHDDPLGKVKREEGIHRNR